MNFDVALLFLFLFIFIGILVKSADFIEDSFVIFAKKIRISEFLFGFFFLGIISSLPEIFVAVDSSRKVPELSVGNLYGATLVLLTLVMGLTVIRFRNVHFKGHFGESEILSALLCLLMTVVVIVDKKLFVVEGVILISAYVIYIIHLFFKFKRKEEKLYEEVKVNSAYASVLLLKAIVGIIFLLISSNMIVDIVLEIGDKAGINPALIGLLVLGIGTNSPELVILLRAKDFDHEKLAIGNFLGSATINSAILGMLAILSGGFEVINFVSIVPVLVILTINIVLFAIFSWTGRRLSLTEGVILVALYFSLVITEVGLIIFK